jgi:START domain
VQNPLQGAFSSHREFFIQRSCRRDDDDSHVVLLHSVDREAHDFEATPGHVEGVIKSMGFTVAPLKPRYRRSASLPALDSHECLVTLVLSLDLGGWLGANSCLRYWLPFWSELEACWVQKLLMTLVALGNKVRCVCCQHSVRLLPHT